MPQLRNLEPRPKKMTPNDVYLRGLFWILRERAGAGGWPPRDICKVSGWTVIKLLAHISDRSPREVAGDVIQYSEHLEQEEAQP